MIFNYLPQWRIAIAFGIYRPKFVRRLKKELTPEETQKILTIIRWARKQRRLVEVQDE